MVFSLVPIALAQNNQTDDNETEDDTVACCEAANAECLACSEGESVEDYCTDNPKVVGCEDYNTEDDSYVNDNNSDMEDEETVKEVEVMIDHLGAKVRLIQLEIAVKTAIIKGGVVVDYIKNTTDANTTKLDEVLDDLAGIAEEVNAMRNSDEVPEDAVEKFVEYKKLSIDLIKKFRDEGRTILDESDVSALRELLRNADYSAIDELRQERNDMIREHNANRLGKILGRIGEKNPELAEKIRNGEIDAKTVKNRIKEAYKKVDKEKIKKAFEKMKEARKEAEKARVEARKAFQKSKEEMNKLRATIQDVRKDRNNTIKDRIQNLREKNAQLRDRAPVRAPLEGGN